MYEYVYEYGDIMSRLFDHEDLRVYQTSIDFVAWLETLFSNFKKEFLGQDYRINRMLFLL